jgi:hypothetical protein
MTTQTRTTSDRSNGTALAAFAFGAVAVVTAAFVAIVAFGGAGNGNPNQGGVVVPPPASPSVPATPSIDPSARPTTAPHRSSKPDEPIKVRIATVNHANVTVDIVDETLRVLDARSGPPIEGASVDFDRLQVENAGPTTLRLTWSDYPMPTALTLFVSETNGRVRLVLVRPGPTGTTDAMAFDRQMLVRLASPIDAANVDPFVQDGLDTAS